MAIREREANVGIIFKIIMKHFSGDTFCQNQDVIFNCVLEVFNRCRDHAILREDTPTLENSDVNHGRDTLRYLNYFGLVENPEHKCWRIKSVDEMCERLCGLADDPSIAVRELNHPISLAFGIIIRYFNGKTVSKTDIKTKIETEIENYRTHQGGLSALMDWHVNGTLRFLNYFDLADKRGQSHWRIKSVDEMCERLRRLRRTFHLL